MGVCRLHPVPERDHQRYVCLRLLPGPAQGMPAGRRSLLKDAGIDRKLPPDDRPPVASSDVIAHTLAAPRLHCSFSPSFFIPGTACVESMFTEPGSGRVVASWEAGEQKRETDTAVVAEFRPIHGLSRGSSFLPKNALSYNQDREQTTQLDHSLCPASERSMENDLRTLEGRAVRAVPVSRPLPLRPPRCTPTATHTPQPHPLSISQPLEAQHPPNALRSHVVVEPLRVHSSRAPSRLPGDGLPSRCARLWSRQHVRRRRVAALPKLTRESSARHSPFSRARRSGTFASTEGWAQGLTSFSYSHGGTRLFPRAAALAGYFGRLGRKLTAITSRHRGHACGAHQEERRDSRAWQDLWWTRYQARLLW